MIQSKGSDNAETFNKYFANITDSLNIHKRYNKNSNSPLDDIQHFNFHPSFKKIRHEMAINNHFSFCFVSTDTVLKCIKT